MARLSHDAMRRAQKIRHTTGAGRVSEGTDLA